MSEPDKTSGVQQLIDRLSQEGVAAGQQQAETIVTDATRKADDIVESARRQSKEILQQARDEVERLQSAGKEALQLAARDTMRDFSARIHSDFRHRLQELVRHQLQDPLLIKKMILEVTRQATAGRGDGPVEILLPLEVISEPEVRKQIEADDPDALTQFVEGLIGEDLRAGFTVSLGSRTHEGFTVRVVDDKLEIDLSDEAIAEFLSLHLMPRFRAIMRKP
jgi:V/A-type H+-transporting ATPase subunit E